MVKTLTISNFQSHKKTTLSFSPGVNWIVGSSDSGKSAIIRALRWVWYNEPSGFSFRSWWANRQKTEVVVEHIEGPVIGRIRDTSNNKYVLDGRELVSFGNDVPDVIAAAANVDVMNVQQQGDRPFLLDMSPPDVARLLNSVANLTVIDEAHTRIAGKLRTCDAETNQHTARRDEAASQLEKYGDLDNLYATIEAAAKCEKDLAARERDTSALRGLIMQHEGVNSRLELFTCIDTIECGPFVKHALSFTLSVQRQETLRSLVQQEAEVGMQIQRLAAVVSTACDGTRATETAFRLQKTLAECETLQSLVRRNDNVSQQLERLGGAEVLPTLTEQAKQVAWNLEKNQREWMLLRSLLDRAAAVDADIVKQNEDEARLQKERKDTMPDTCPLCGSILCKTQH